MSRSDDHPVPPNHAPRGEERSLAEWITFGIASLILTILLGLIGYLWAIETHNPPKLSVTQADPLWEADGQFYVPFEVTNSGGETVDAVRVTAELHLNGELEEEGEQEISFLSPQEKEVGAFIFRQDPRQGHLILRVVSYKIP